MRFPSLGALACRPEFKTPGPHRRGSGPPPNRLACWGPTTLRQREGTLLSAAAGCAGATGSGHHSGHCQGPPVAGAAPRSGLGATGTFSPSGPAAAHVQGQTLQAARVTSGVSPGDPPAPPAGPRERPRPASRPPQPRARTPLATPRGRGAAGAYAALPSPWWPWLVDPWPGTAGSSPVPRCRPEAGRRG